MRTLMMTAVVSVLLAGSLAAQTATKAEPAAPPPSLKSLGMVIYPAKGQPADQQAKDEAECTAWAEEQTGIRIGAGQVDTKAAAKAAGDQAAAATQGAAVAGAARGAVAGTAVGAIAGDAGKGAAIGAVAGASGGRRAKKEAEARAKQQGAAQATAQNQARIDQFKKAAGACLSGRGYTVG